MEDFRNNSHNPKQPVFIQPKIGLDSDVRHSVVDLLNITLANEAVLQQKPAVLIGMLRREFFLNTNTNYRWMGKFWSRSDTCPSLQ